MSRTEHYERPGMATLTLDLDPDTQARLAELALQEGHDVPSTAAAILSAWMREREEELEELREMIDASDAEGGELTDEDVRRSLDRTAAAVQQRMN